MKLCYLVQKRIVRLVWSVLKEKKGKLNIIQLVSYFTKNFKIEIQKKISNLLKNMIENCHTQLFFSPVQNQTKEKNVPGFFKCPTSSWIFALLPLSVIHTTYLWCNVWYWVKVVREFSSVELQQGLEIHGLKKHGP